MHALFAKVNGQWRFEGILVEDAGVPYLNVIKKVVEEENGLDTFRVFDLDANQPVSGLSSSAIALRLTSREADEVISLFNMVLTNADQWVDTLDLSALRRATEKLAVAVQTAG